MENVNQVLSREEYLTFEKKAERKHDFYDGKMIAKEDSSRRHNILSGRIATQLDRILNPQAYQVYDINMKVDIPQYQAFVYPDCCVEYQKETNLENDLHFISPPIIIVEVLSTTSEAFDRGQKFFWYRSLSSLKTYILISQHEEKIEVYSKQSDNIWRMAFYSAGDTIELVSAEASFHISDIYRDMFT